MEFEVNVPTYKRIDNKKSNKRINFRSSVVNITMTIIIGLTLGRVSLNFVEGLTLAPFGIAYLMSIILKRDEKQYLPAFLAVAVGYLSIYGVLDNTFVYLGIATLILLYGYIY